MPLDGRVVWVTGGGSGIGRAAAIELARAGARVVISGRRREALEQVVAEIATQGGDAAAEPLDVTDGAAAASIAATIFNKRRRLDVVVVAAGNNIPNRKWSELTHADWMDVHAANTHGAFFCIHAALPYMRRQREGVIINVGSWGGRFALKLTGAAYAASKRALMAMTESLNMEEWQSGIRACVILPAAVNTPFLRKRATPVPEATLASMLQPEDIARVVRFVAESPPHVCVNEILISPTENYVYIHSA
jgi:NAD(P)-dependent dehydrogenase (short-subunit alcohol dehydrogenase family)